MNYSSSPLWYKQFAKWLYYKYFNNHLDLKILELGNGKGLLTKSFKEMGYDIIGFDKEMNLEKKIPLKSYTYDIIILYSVIEHISNFQQLIKEIHRILKYHGIVIIATNDITKQFKEFYDDYTHISPFTMKRLKNLMIDNNFKVIELRRFPHIPFFWRYTIKAFDITTIKPGSLFGVFEK